MKIVFNLSTCSNPLENFYVISLKKNNKFFFESSPNYKLYTHALFMQSPNSYNEMVRAKNENFNIKIGLIDPRGEGVLPYIGLTDFIIVNGVEKSDYFSKWQPNIFLYYDYPDIVCPLKRHEKKSKFVIGYHGNKIHLASIFPNITQALEELGKRYDLEFLAMYNIEKLGIWKSGIPKGVKIRHVQWSFDNYVNELSKADVGIVPCQTPIRFPRVFRFFSRICGDYFLERASDHLVRYKVPSSFGRAFVFAKLGIPVVVDVIPSASKFIDHGYSGFLANSSGSWYASIEKLLNCHDYRNHCSRELYEKTESVLDANKQNINLLHFFKELPSKGTSGMGVVDEFGFVRYLVFSLQLNIEKMQTLKARLLNKVMSEK